MTFFFYLISYFWFIFLIFKFISKGEYSDNQDYFRCALKTFECLIFGALEATIISKGLGFKIVIYKLSIK